MTNDINNLNFSLSPEASASTHDEGIVILHTGKGRVFSSNKTGAAIWRGIEQGRTFDAILEEVSSEFQIAGPTARAHAIKFLAALEHHALVRREVAS